MELTKNQKQIFTLTENTNDNALVLGKPGVGKSVLINELTMMGNKSYTLGAPTGLAALNIDGRTLHSIFKIPVSDGIIHPTYNKYPTEMDRAHGFIKFQLRTLIIDEISMVRCDIMDYIDRCLRHVKGDDRPFGGIQVIAFGDFYQLPPVVKGYYDLNALKLAGYKSPFMFDSRVYKEGGFQTRMLNEVLRQKGDPDFIDLLDYARDGNVPQKMLTKLNKLVGQPYDIRIRLCATNKQADTVNQSYLDVIPESPTIFYAEKFGEWPANPAQDQLTLKLGAQVMVKKNRADKPPGLRGEFESRIVNGTLGVVVDIHESTEPEDEAWVKIKTNDGLEAKIYTSKWERKKKEQDIDGKWTERVVAWYIQMPLQLAWAISIHKSQGQSFDLVHIDSNRIFAPGQLYVALSRCRSMAGISLESPVTYKQFMTDRDVVNFFNLISV